MTSISDIEGFYKTTTEWIGDALSPLIVNDDGSVDIAGTTVTATLAANGVLSIPQTTVGKHVIGGSVTFDDSTGTWRFSGPLNVSGYGQGTYSGVSDFRFQSPTLQDALMANDAFESGDIITVYGSNGLGVVEASNGTLQASGQGVAVALGVIPGPNGIKLAHDGTDFVVASKGSPATLTGTEDTATPFNIMATMAGTVLLVPATSDGGYVTLGSDGTLTVADETALTLAMEWDVHIQPVEPAVLMARWGITPNPEVTACETDMARLCWQVTGGFFLAMGLGSYMSTGHVRVGVMGLLQSNATVWGKVTAAVAVLKANPKISASAMAGLVTGILGAAWSAGLLWKLLKLILSYAGWWILFKILAKVIEVVFLPEAEIAELIASFAVWAGTLATIAVDISHDCLNSLANPKPANPQAVPV